MHGQVKVVVLEPFCAIAKQVIFDNTVSAENCATSDGKCVEASECKYISTDSFDCTVKRKVCCYNDHDYIDA